MVKGWPTVRIYNFVDSFIHPMHCYRNGCTLTFPSSPQDSKPSAVSAKPVTIGGGPPNDLDLNASVKKLRPETHARDVNAVHQLRYAAMSSMNTTIADAMMPARACFASCCMPKPLQAITHCTGCGFRCMWNAITC